MRGEETRQSLPTATRSGRLPEPAETGAADHRGGKRLTDRADRIAGELVVDATDIVFAKNMGGNQHNGDFYHFSATRCAADRGIGAQGEQLVGGLSGTLGNEPRERDRLAGRLARTPHAVRGRAMQRGAPIRRGRDPAGGALAGASAPPSSPKLVRAGTSHAGLGTTFPLSSNQAPGEKKSFPLGSRCVLQGEK